LPLIGRVFFIWISVYNLFVVSIFWQLNVDLFSPEQGKRLFGFIAAGATLGAIVGSSLTASLARLVPPMVLLIGAAVLLEVAVFAVSRLARLSPRLSQRREFLFAPAILLSVNDRRLLWVKLRKSHVEHMLSALPPITDIRPLRWHPQDSEFPSCTPTFKCPLQVDGPQASTCR
jgi:hypothetical protein